MTAVEVPKRGSEQRPYALSEEADCLSEMSMMMFTNDPTMMNSPKCMKATIQGHGGEVSKRKVCPVWILHHGYPEFVYADTVTGTLYHKSGECLSSDVRKIVKMTKWVEPKKQKVRKGRTLLQDRWNKGL